MADDPEAARFWHKKPDASAAYRVWLRPTRAAATGTLLDQEQIGNNPAIRNTPIDYRAGTNYKLRPHAADELNKLWSRFLSPEKLEELVSRFNVEAAELEKLPLAGLLDEYHRSRMKTLDGPLRTGVTTSVFQRDPLVKAIARVRAGFRCEIPNCPAPSFPSLSDEPYCEVHHLLRLADGGKDTIENVVCVCANHHRELHIGRRRGELTSLLQAIRS